jgi:hypothetical protein
MYEIYDQKYFVTGTAKCMRLIGLADEEGVCCADET